MLVLSRRKNESIMIGDIELVVVDIRGDRVRLGIGGNPGHTIHRREALEPIRRPEDSSGERRPIATQRHIWTRHVSG